MECLGGKTNNKNPIVTVIFNNCHQKSGLTIKQKCNKCNVLHISNLKQISFTQLLSQNRYILCFIHKRLSCFLIIVYSKVQVIQAQLLIHLYYLICQIKMEQLPVNTEKLSLFPKCSPWNLDIQDAVLHKESNLSLVSAV